MSEVSLQSVSVTYSSGPAVVRVNHTVASGEWVSLIGPNGAGKTSLLRACLGLVKHQGTIRINGTDLSTVGVTERSRMIAYAPQTPRLPQGMTALEYVLLGRTPYISRFGSDSAKDRLIACDVLERLDMGRYRTTPLGSLSGGEQQRIVIARALAQQASVLLLDEPTASLDVGHQQQALELVDRLRRESSLTVISAMHDLTLSGLYCDRLALIRCGSIIATGPARDVLRADLLESTYGAAVRVLHDDDGTVIVVPTRKPDKGTPDV